ncbi:hypothetical protein V3589_11030 [Sinorhizobium fredii]|uniref:hypothetical protein n=1 Tax=Rhizobium fredii TaxID=380 RepID=UPI0030A16AF0
MTDGQKFRVKRFAWSKEQGGPGRIPGEPAVKIAALRLRIDHIKEGELRQEAINAANASDLEALLAVFRHATFDDA